MFLDKKIINQIILNIKIKYHKKNKMQCKDGI